MSVTKKETIELSEWSLWANHVFAELKRLNECVEGMKKDLTQVTMEVVQLKVKSSLWGAASGAITVLMIFAIGWAKESKSQSPVVNPIYYQIPTYPTLTITPPGTYQTPPNVVTPTVPKTP